MPPKPPSQPPEPRRGGVPRVAVSPTRGGTLRFANPVQAPAGTEETPPESDPAPRSSGRASDRAPASNVRAGAISASPTRGGTLNMRGLRDDPPPARPAPRRSAVRGGTQTWESGELPVIAVPGSTPAPDIQVEEQELDLGDLQTALEEEDAKGR